MNLTALLAILQDAPATPDAAAPRAENPWQFPLMIAVIIAIFWFLVIGPDRKNRKRREEMLKKLSKGDKVLTTSGMYATVAAIEGDRVTLQLDEGVRVRFARAAIQDVVSEEPAASKSGAASKS
jgi:preprotein translocase subunit YajC